MNFGFFIFNMVINDGTHQHFIRLTNISHLFNNVFVKRGILTNSIQDLLILLVVKNVTLASDL